ncbi:MAG: glycosyltransferase family 2 protein [Candidatus Velthaea sp.]
MTPPTPRISVVIPTYNRLDTLQHVIPALLAQDIRPEDYEVIVADSNSTDGTREYLASVVRDAPRVRHVPGPYTGRAGARNAGIAQAAAPLVLFTDADIIASHDLLGRHLARHAKAGGPRAVVGLEVQVDSFEDYLRKSRTPGLRGSLHPPSRTHIDWLYFMTGNASVPRAELDRLGGFDEDFTGYGHEDLELGYRLRAAGLAIEYAPEAINYHWHPVPFDQQQSRMELAGRSTVRFYRKHSTFGVRAKLGMTPVSLALHTLVDRAPALKSWIEANAVRPGFARSLSYQYHYLTGVKAALRGNH